MKKLDNYDKMAVCIFTIAMVVICLVLHYTITTGQRLNSAHNETTPFEKMMNKVGGNHTAFHQWCDENLEVVKRSYLPSRHTFSETIMHGKVTREEFMDFKYRILMQYFNCSVLKLYITIDDDDMIIDQSEMSIDVLYANCSRAGVYYLCEGVWFFSEATNLYRVNNHVGEHYMKAISELASRLIPNWVEWALYYPITDEFDYMRHDWHDYYLANNGYDI